jgi:hypothetical protein
MTGRARPATLFLWRYHEAIFSPADEAALLHKLIEGKEMVSEAEYYDAGPNRLR